MAEKFEELDKDLSNTTAHIFPEEYVRKTLIAHGFFTHAKLLEEHKRQLKEDRTGVKRLSEGLITDGISEEEKKRTTQLIYHYREGKEFHSLREPLGIAPRRQRFSSQSLPKWPAEVNCLDHCSVFINDQPLLPEPLLKPDMSLISPKIRSAFGEGTVVYVNRPGPQKFFTQSRSGPSTNEPYPRQRIYNDEILGFESRFESGNLAKAVRVGRWDYELYLRCDLFTQKHTQWFFFGVQNMRAGQTYRFTIVNLYKPSSLYNDGMQPLLHSEIRAKLHKIGWRRVGFNIKYFKTNIRRTGVKSEINNYGLTWSYTFQYDGDTCYFAHCYPYTYTDLQEYLRGIAKDPKKSIFCKQRSLCHSIAGNEVPLLTITSPSGSLNEAQNKRTIVVSARVHPGETNGSWMMKGMIDFLVSDSPDAQILRDAFMFKIIPMLNPDGVIVGNYRCSLSGRDLNRNYKSQLKDAYPTIWHTKQLIKQMAKEREVVLYCDFHGHSRKQNVFIYGCDRIQDPSVRLRSRVFPKMLSLNAPNKFSFRGCNFKVQKTKEGTGRVFMWREMGIVNSYTMEATFCGSNLGTCEGYHFSTKEFELMGYHFCDTLLDYCDPDQTKVEYVLNQLTEDYRQAIVDKLQSLGVNVPDGVDPLDVEFDSDILSGVDSSDEGSDSSESDGPPVQLMDKMGKKKRNKKLQTRKERNRRKAQLKLTHKAHQSPSHTQTKKEENISLPKQTEKHCKSGSISNCTEEKIGTSATPVNGGLPKFVQERISGRQKKDSISGVSHEIQAVLQEEPDYVETVTADYVRNGLPQNASLLANKELQISTASLISQPKGCPIAISSMILRDPSTSRVSSSTSLLPQIDTEPSADQDNRLRGGAFASNYLANRLKDESELETVNDSTPDSTRNLVGLSKLFRTLKPHLVKPNSSRPSVDKNEDKDSNKIPSAGQVKPKLKMEYVLLNGTPITPRNLSSRASMQQQPDEKAPDHQPNLSNDPSTEDISKKSLSGASIDNSKLPPVVKKSGSLTSQGNLSTEHSKATTIGETDTTALSRQHEVSKQTSNSGSSVSKDLQSPSGSSLRDNLLHLMQPPTTSLQLTLGKKSTVQENDKTHVTTNRSSTYTSSSVKRHNTIQGLSKVDTTKVERHSTQTSQLESIEVHKQNIATAVETIQNKRRLFKDTSYHSKDRPHTSFSFPPPPIDSSNTNTCMNSNGNNNIGASKRAVFLGSPQINTGSRLTNSNTRREIHTSESSDRRRTRSRKNNTLPSSSSPSNDRLPQWKMYYSSNKLAPSSSREDKGSITPATVSLMLPVTGRHDTIGPPANTLSSRNQKSLNTKYYLNYKKGFF